MKTVGMITIGQSPRDDLMPQFRELLGSGYRILEAGALDGLSPAEIAARAPQPGQHPLITRLADGTEAIVGKELILALLQERIAMLERDADLLVILCTGTFPPFRCAKPILEPDRILFAALQAVYREGTLGVLNPIAAQAESAAARFCGVTPRLAIEAASPYQGAAELRAAAGRLKAAQASLVVMNCMGFTETHKRALRDITGTPALLPSSLLARFIAEVA
jgi:protein AroM